uniref:Secreted protein n=1 Tax=Steinernema glaseri TaxID=37863 RepID=A0A1I8AH42_9BILA
MHWPGSKMHMLERFLERCIAAWTIVNAYLHAECPVDSRGITDLSSPTIELQSGGCFSFVNRMRSFSVRSLLERNERKP